ncbi:MAG TPA: ATP-binding protein [Acidisarcina sp.]|nr:ATP-binding protein [Acidisarcina sp.]
MSASKVAQLELMKAESFRKQQTAFCVLTLFVIAVLLLLHTLFASLLDEPSIWIILLLGCSFSVKVIELAWLQGRTEGISEETARRETALSITGLFILSASLIFLTNHDDAPYLVLLVIPILQCAFCFGLVPTIVTIVTAIGMIFYWLWHFFTLHPPQQPSEYLEGGMISIIFALVGVIVWFLVHQRIQQQAMLSDNIAELEATREKLAVEERLAAVGRLAGGIAHEIRNPVAMISSSLTTAANPEVRNTDREAMLQIAAKEAERLERLTTDFLSYARPNDPKRISTLVSDLFAYTADVVKAYASARSIKVTWSAAETTPIQVDPSQVQQALLNLVLNGIDATDSPGAVVLRADRTGRLIQIDVQNTGARIPDSDLSHIFEPFYSTKPTGTGLGLSIAHCIAQAHGGDLWVSRNEEGSVTFSMTLADASGAQPE